MDNEDDPGTERPLGPDSRPVEPGGNDAGGADSLEDSWAAGSAGSAGDFTRRLRRGGDPRNVNALLAMVYAELHRMAVAEKVRFPENSLQATEVLNAAYLRLMEKGQTSWKNRRWFFHLAGRAMRDVIWDHLRSRNRQKRRLQAVSLDSICEKVGAEPHDLAPLTAALRRLGEEDRWSATVVELRFFYGLTREEIAAQLGISTRTVDRRWAFSRARLRQLIMT